jgi:hypothetical protein
VRCEVEVVERICQQRQCWLAPLSRPQAANGLTNMEFEIVSAKKNKGGRVLLDF